ncbi:Hint domain-containing protein [Frigidibacter sp. SD6-1]|uniref:Hint domain-containing protein n=1 Tax=Frigidibacter sp. SD6-1 TaxID=3032581 RepID=UPI0024E00AFB|nr:Hint domain-containing protein [Frigidibacter sp. SD6-1]
MATSYTDQFFAIDASVPPAVGTPITFSLLTITDQNDDGDFDRFNNDSVNGADIRRSWPGDTITVNVPGVGNVTYTGTTFELQGGGVVFTPTDGQVLMNGTFVSSTFVNTQGPTLATELGPACLVIGTRIAVPGGEVAVETLRPGDLVETLDHGPQPLRWAGREKVRGVGPLAPVRFAAGTLDNARPLYLSPQHRVLQRGWRADLHFGADEVLAAALHLVNGVDVTRAPCRELVYVHLLFDRHEIIRAEGAPVESLLPSARAIERDPALAAEIRAVFPELLSLPAADRPRAARPVVPPRHAPVLQRSRTAVRRRT